MEIVVEYVLVDNLVINTLILFFSATILKIKKSKLRLFVSAVLGTACSLITPILNLPLWLMIVYKLLLGLVMARIGLDPSGLKQNIVFFGVFLLLTGVVGGVCFGLVYLFSGEASANGIVVFGSEIPVGAVLGVVCLTFLAIWKLFNHLSRKKLLGTFIFKAEIENEGKKTNFDVFLDSGNTLFDPITKKPVLIVEFSLFKQIVNVPFEKVITKKIGQEDIKNSRYLPYGTVGGQGEMLVFEIEKFLLKKEKEEKIFKGAVVGLSLSGLKKSFGCQALIGPEFAKEFVLWKFLKEF